MNSYFYLCLSQTTMSDIKMYICLYTGKNCKYKDREGKDATHKELFGSSQIKYRNRDRIWINDLREVIMIDSDSPLTEEGAPSRQLHRGWKLESILTGDETGPYIPAQEIVNTFKIEPWYLPFLTTERIMEVCQMRGLTIPQFNDTVSILEVQAVAYNLWNVMCRYSWTITDGYYHKLITNNINCASLFAKYDHDSVFTQLREILTNKYGFEYRFGLLYIKKRYNYELAVSKEIKRIVASRPVFLPYPEDEFSSDEDDSPKTSRKDVTTKAVKEILDEPVDGPQVLIEGPRVITDDPVDLSCSPAKTDDPIDVSESQVEESPIKEIKTKIYKPKIYKPKTTRITPDGIVLDSEQIDAIHHFQSKNLTLISGPPGSGKTTILKEIARILKGNGLSFMLMSFTGQACNRISEVTGETARTIHSSLGHFKTSSSCVIIDEFSMVSFPLLFRLLTSRKIDRLVLVGDLNQLPPIQLGRIYHYMFDAFPNNIINLKTNHRSVNSIYQNYMLAVNGSPMLVSDDKFVRLQSDINLLYLLVERLMHMKDERGVNKWKILCPFVAHCGMINTKISEIYAKGKYIPDFKTDPNEEDYKRTKVNGGFKVGDHIVFNHNYHPLRIVNGTNGVIVGELEKYFVTIAHTPNLKRSKISLPTGLPQDPRPEGLDVTIYISKDSINREEEALYQQKLSREPFFEGWKTSIRKDFPEGPVHPPWDLNDINLNYAITVHKSQGSEYPYTLIYFPKGKNGVPCCNELFIVALTRAKDMCYLFSEQRDLEVIIGRRSATDQSGIKFLMDEM